MAVMTDNVRQKVRQMFETQLAGPLSILVFFEGDDEYTAATREVVTELAALSDGKITFTEVPVTEKADQAKAYGIDKTPALAFLDAQGNDQRFRFFGAPVGYAFMSLLDDIIDVSKGETRLTEKGREQIKAIAEDVVIQVFSTPG